LSEKKLTNKIANKAIIQLDIEKLIPKATDIVAFDIKGFLFKELLLKEKDFRNQLVNFNFSNFSNKFVYIYCSNSAIVPLWAYMLLSSYIAPLANKVVFAMTEKEAVEKFLKDKISHLSLDEYKNQRVIVKGCSHQKLSPDVYITLVEKLQPVVKTIMFGEACSMLPIYKK